MVGFLDKKLGDVLLVNGISEIKNSSAKLRNCLAGETRLEHATNGFGDRDSTIELRPCEHIKLYYIKISKSTVFGD